MIAAAGMGKELAKRAVRDEVEPPRADLFEGAANAHVGVKAARDRLLELGEPLPLSVGEDIRRAVAVITLMPRWCAKLRA